MNENQNIYALLDAYFRGDLSPEEAGLVEDWITSSEENRRLAGEFSKINFLTDALDSDRSDNALLALKSVRSSIRHGRVRKAALRLGQAAAVVAIPLLVLCTWLFFSIRKEYNADIEIHCATGMTTSLILPDSTKVWLNSNTRLVYPARFTGGERRIVLEGEGYFEVAPNSKSFVVEAGPALIEVYGTKFNIEAYPYAEDIRTTLVSGKVGFRYDNPQGESTLALLEPGQMLSYNRNGGQVWTRAVDPAVGTSWKDGRILLRDTPLKEALMMVGNKYNVAFVISDDKLLENTVVGSFSSHTLDAVLSSFTLSSDIHFRKVPVDNGGEYSGRETIEVY
ncbi:MAG: FecR domain-containing protein [Alistipes sp.]|nr:FecR domain-containing protein [Alistipes sp.]